MYGEHVARDNPTYSSEHSAHSPRSIIHRLPHITNSNMNHNNHNMGPNNNHVTNHSTDNNNNSSSHGTSPTGNYRNGSGGGPQPATPAPQREPAQVPWYGWEP